VGGRRPPRLDDPGPRTFAGLQRGVRFVLFEHEHQAIGGGAFREPRGCLALRCLGPRGVLALRGSFRSRLLLFPPLDFIAASLQAVAAQERSGSRTVQPAETTAAVRAAPDRVSSADRTWRRWSWGADLELMPAAGVVRYRCLPAVGRRRHHAAEDPTLACEETRRYLT
jgi:hypothetical protein